MPPLHLVQPKLDLHAGLYLPAAVCRGREATEDVQAEGLLQGVFQRKVGSMNLCRRPTHKTPVMGPERD
eukprot:1139873-Pelagomonas_calceolata.AAC.3